MAADLTVVCVLRAVVAIEIVTQASVRALPFLGGSAVALATSIVWLVAKHVGAISAAQLVAIVGFVTAFVFVGALARARS